MPIEQVKFVGDETEVSCPVCHCDILKVPEKLPEVYCPACWVRGTVYSDGSKMKVKWNEEDINNPRHSPHVMGEHRKAIASRHKEFIDNQEEVKVKIKKYVSYGNIIRP